MIAAAAALCALTATAQAQSATITVASIPTVVAGNTITVSYTVRNTGTSSRTFGVGAEIRQGASSLADLGTRTTPTISPGGTASGSFTYTIPSGWSGTYTARAAVWTGTPGSSTWLNSYDRDFTVQAQVTSATISVAAISTVVAGNSITVSYTVNNTGNYSRSFGVGAEIQQGGSALADLGTRTTSTIAPGNSASGSFTYTIPSGWSSGTYTAHAAVWTGTPGSSTWLNSYDRNFTVQARITSANISVAAISTVVAGNSVTVSYTVNNTGNYSQTFGVGAEIRQGGSVLADLGAQTTATVSAGGSTSGSFTYTVSAGWSSGTYTARAIVWTSTPGTSTWLNSYDRDFTVQAQVTSATISVAAIPTIVAGNPITVSYTVNNTGNYDRTFGVGTEIREGAATMDTVGAQTTPVVSPGGTANGSFTYTIPSSWAGGTYTARAVVWTGTPGSSTWLDNFDRDFTVQQPPLAIAGRLVYHSYSSYLAAPLDANDGHVFICPLPSGPLRKLTQGLPVENAMNPHISADGSRVTFMAIPQGAARNRNSLEIYVYNLAAEALSRLTSDSTPDEDPKFSPDGQQIVFKRNGQIWTMNSDGGNPAQITSTASEKSGPNYSPDGANIVYWSDARANADIWVMSSAGTGATKIIGTLALQEYYPIYRDAQTILFTRWESAADTHDKIFSYSTTSGSTQRLPLNQAGANDSDSFPVDSTLIGFSSDRVGGKGGYDVYVGNPSTGAVYPVSAANSGYHDLGGSFSPYSNARELVGVTPAGGAQLPSGSVALLTVRARSNGGVWSGAMPKVVMQGPVNAEFTGLHDDGMNGDQTAGDGIYSASVTLPSQSGTYALYSSATSTDNGLTVETRSSSITVTLQQPPTAPSANPASSLTSSEFTANWSSVSGATGYRLDVSTSSSFTSYISGYQDLDVGNVTSREVSGLSANTPYYYRVRAYNTGGTSGDSNTNSVTTLANPPSPPTANPASAITSSGFTANWSSASGATGYRLDVSTNDGFSSFVSSYQDLDVGNVTSRAVSGLSAGTTHYYRVRACNAGGPSGNSGTISLATTPPTVAFTRQGANLVFSWPTNTVGFVLEYATNLPATTWTTASPAPVVVGGQNVVTNTVSGGARFYRLKKP